MAVFRNEIKKGIRKKNLSPGHNVNRREGSVFLGHLRGKTNILSYDARTKKKKRRKIGRENNF